MTNFFFGGPGALAKVRLLRDHGADVALGDLTEFAAWYAGWQPAGPSV